MANFGTGHEWLMAIADALAANTEFAEAWTIVTNNDAITSAPTAPTVYLEWVSTGQGALSEEDPSACGHVVAAILVFPHGASPNLTTIREKLATGGQDLVEALSTTAGVPTPSTWSMDYTPKLVVSELECSVLAMQLETNIY